MKCPLDPNNLFKKYLMCACCVLDTVLSAVYVLTVLLLKSEILSLFYSRETRACGSKALNW